MTNKTWQPEHRFESSAGTVAYDVRGTGEPLVLVHGTPASSYLWRGVVDRLTDRFRVYTYDLPGYGRSDRYEGQDVSNPMQARVLGELLDEWGLTNPSIAGHDIGAAVVMRATLIDGRSFARIALCDAALIDWITPFTAHVGRHLEAFAGVPEYIHAHLVTAHLRTAFATELDDAALSPYLRPWLGPEGQAAYYRQVGQFDFAHTTELEQRFGELGTPTLVLWGEQDAWLSAEQGKRLAEAVPGARLELVPGAGHFLQEDQPELVAERFRAFFG